MNEKDMKKSAHLIIHGVAAASVIAAGAWSSLPIVGPFSIIVSADAPILASLTAGMVISLGRLFGHSYTKSAVMSVVGNLVGLVFGVNIARGLAALIPGVGAAANAVTTAALQETIGWVFTPYLRKEEIQLKCLRKISMSMLKKRKKIEESPK